jgi:general secretion pathway protein D
VFAALFAIVLAPAAARTRKGDKLLKEAQRAEAEKDWDTALALYDQALATDPKDANYLLFDQRIHARAALERIAAGRELLKAQKLDAALLQFQKAYLADPSSQIALQEIRTTTQMIKERAKAPAGTPIYTPAERARMEIERRINALQGLPQLEPITAQISSLKVNNQPARVLYESVCKLAGLNLLVDPAGLGSGGGTGGNYNLDLNNVTIQEALNYVALITHTFWKPISRNTIFVAQEGEQKRQEYQDEVVKVFYIQNATTPQEFQEIFNAVRVGAKMTSNMFQVTSQNAIIARGSPDTIALVEKLVHDLDRPKPEIMMDVIVMSVNKDVRNTIGAALLGQGGLSVPLNFTPRNTTPASQTGSSGNGSNSGSGPVSTTPQVTISQLGHLSSADYSTTLPSTVVQALLNNSQTKILQRPQLRAIDNGKASLKIGQKIPYVSGSLNSAVATPGSIPYATTQFQQVEVGTLIDFQPHVNGPEDVYMHVRVELSNKLSDVTIAGIAEPIIGQQIDEADIRMRDGEVSILGGLSDRENSNLLTGVPGFTNIPLLGYVFGSKTRENIDNEILIAVIPHIVRAPEYADLAGTGVYAGTERVPRVERSPQTQQQTQQQQGPQATLPIPGGPAAGVPQPANPNEVRPSFPIPASVAPNAAPGPGTTTPAAGPATSVAPFPSVPAPTAPAPSSQPANPPQPRQK